VAELIEFTDSDEESGTRRREPFRNGRILYPSSSLGHCETSGIETKIGECVILSPEWSLSGDDRTDFLWVNYIIRNNITSATTLRGYRMVFFESLGGLSMHKDELCMLLHVDENDKRHFNIQGQIEVPLTAVIGKSTVRMATGRSSMANTGARQSENTELPATLCTRILMHLSKTAKERIRSVKGGKRQYLAAKNAWSQHKSGSVEANEKTYERGQILYIGRGCSGFIYRRFASYELEPHVLIRQLEELERRSVPTVTSVRCTDREIVDITEDRRPYYCADYCAGLGGSAEGSRKAGFVVASLIDSAAECCRSLEAKFPGAIVRQMRLEDYVDRLSRGKNLLPHDGIVYLHVSFPCSYYSQAHTIARTDETEEAEIEAILHLLPHVVKEHYKHGLKVFSMEEAPTLATFERHHHRFISLVGEISDELDWSIAAKVVNFRDYESSGCRERLVLFASA